MRYGVIYIILVWWDGPIFGSLNMVLLFGRAVSEAPPGNNEHGGLLFWKVFFSRDILLGLSGCVLV